METAIYYTFSTIPQVLAGAIALLGVFVLYKIQQINSQLIGFGDAIMIELQNIGEADKLEHNRICMSRLAKAINRKDINDMKVQIDIISATLDKEIASQNEAEYEASYTKRKVDIEIIQNQKSILINKTIIATIWSCIVIIGSIFLIPLAKEITQTCFHIIYLIISLGIVACMSCLYLMVGIIYTALKDQTKTLADYNIDTIIKDLKALKDNGIILDYMLHDKEGIITIIYGSKVPYSKAPPLIKRKIDEIKGNNKPENP